MVKENTMVLIDLEVKQTAKKLGINLSKSLEDTLRALINNYNDGGKQIIELKEELDQLKEMKKELSIKESSIITKIEALELQTKKQDNEILNKKDSMSIAVKRSGLPQQIFG